MRHLESSRLTQVIWYLNRKFTGPADTCLPTVPPGLARRPRRAILGDDDWTTPAPVGLQSRLNRCFGGIASVLRNSDCKGEQLGWGSWCLRGGLIPARDDALLKTGDDGITSQFWHAREEDRRCERRRKQEWALAIRPSSG